MDVSCHGFIHMTRLAEPFVTNGECMLTMTLDGAEEVVEDCSLIRPVKGSARKLRPLRRG